ncbi:MAG TPA: hypothetical protein PL033_05495 [Candidatus Brocadiia bacterium]|nr:hypothetical protein [Candidatus Brocadiia bacterium]
MGIYRRHFAIFFSALAVCSLPPWIVAEAMNSQSSAPGASEADFAPLLRMLLLLPATLVTQVLFYRFSEAMITLMVSNSYLGRPFLMSDIVRQSLRRLPTLLATVMMTLLVTLVAGVIAAIPFIAIAVVIGLSTSGQVVMIIIIMIGTIVCIGVCLLVSLPLFLVSEAVMLERLGAWESMVRSYELVVKKSPKGWLNPANHSLRLGILLLMFFILNVMALLISRLPFSAYGAYVAITQGGGFRAFTETVGSFNLAISLLGMLGSALVQPLGIAATVLFYYDLRVRTEGFDLDLLAKEMGAASPAQQFGDAPK